MASCEELESAILDRVAGTLPAGETAALQVHLDGCPRCQAWQSSCEEAVRLVALPEPSGAELKVFTHLPTRARAAFREQSRRSRWGRALVATAVGGAALAAVLLVVAPLWSGRGVGRGPVAAAAVEEEQEASELVAWALSDPLEDEGLDGFSDEGLDDGSADPGDASELDLDWEQTE